MAATQIEQADDNPTPRKHHPILAIEALKRNMGRPRKWTDPQQILDAALEYFTKAAEVGENITVTGLAAWLGSTRKQLLEYETDHNGVGADSEDIRNAIKHVKHVAEAAAEQHGFNARNPAFAIFALKNYGWKDTQTIETTGTITHQTDPETLQVLGQFLASLSAPRVELPAPMKQVVDLSPNASKVGTKVGNPVDKPSYQPVESRAEVNRE